MKTLSGGDMGTESRAWLEQVAGDVLDHVGKGTFRVADSTLSQPASVYTDPVRFERELGHLFRRVPLLLALSCELRSAGDFKTMDVAGVPVLLTRDKAGNAHALLNICTHRGTQVVSSDVEPCGNAPRFTCPYHGWTFAIDGRLAAVASAADFGAIDKAAYGLRPLPLLERGGMIWVVLDPASTIDIDAFLGTFGEGLTQFDMADWQLVRRETLPGANWKLAFDAHMEFYHLPVLHKNTFGPQSHNRALYYYEGPHQRLIRPHRSDREGMPKVADISAFRGSLQADWPVEAMMLGEWILFPNVSFNSFYMGGRGVLISQIFPGTTVDSSITIQSYYMAGRPSDADRETAVGYAQFLERVVAGEDLPNSFRQQRALASGLLPEVIYGRNEGGLSHFHRWLDRILETPDPALNALFTAQRRVVSPY